MQKPVFTGILTKESLNLTKAKMRVDFLEWLLVYIETKTDLRWESYQKVLIDLNNARAVYNNLHLYYFVNSKQAIAF